MKRKKLYEQQIEQLGNFQLRIHDQVNIPTQTSEAFYLLLCNVLCVLTVLPLIQMIMLEAAKATTETVDALRTGAAAMKAMQKATLVLISSAF